MGVAQPIATDTSMTVLVTAEEAFPAFERRMLLAQRHVRMGFRIFDPLTTLRSPEARAIGSTWVDLLVHTLSRGVSIDLSLTDFDPIAVDDWHACCWKTIRILCGIQELLPEGAGRLRVTPMLHPSRLGAVPHALTRPAVAYKLRRLRRQDLRDKPGVRSALERPLGAWGPSFPVSHHQKLAVFDDEWLYIGGLDLNDRRYDTKRHRLPAQSTWHDVQILVHDRGLARAAHDHLDSFGDVVAAKRSAPDTPGLLRTLSSRHSGQAIMSVGPQPVRQEILDGHMEAIKNAKGLIYLETQFFRYRPLARALAERAEADPDLRLIVVMPGAPESVAFESAPALEGRYGDYLQLRCLRRLARAFGPRALFASPVQPRPVQSVDEGSDRLTLHRAPLVYVHAKVSIFGSDCAIVSSANLNGRSMLWDTEAGIGIRNSQDVMTLRHRLMRHWLPDVPWETASASVTYDRFKAQVEENATLPPERRCGLLVPYRMAKADATAVALPGMPENMV